MRKERHAKPDGRNPILTALQLEVYYDLIQEGTPHKDACRQLDVTHTQVVSTFDVLEDMFDRTYKVLEILERDDEYWNEMMEEDPTGEAGGR